MSRIPNFNAVNLNLPIGDLMAGANAFSGFTGDPAQDLAAIGRNYSQAYGSALNMNSALAQNMQQGYQGILADTQGANAALSRGYSDLSGQVLSGLAGAEASRMTDINDSYARANADTQQSLINRGLGNTTVLDSMQRGNLSDRDRASTRLANEFAQTRAGYQSNLGLQGLNQQGRGIDQALGLGRDFLGYLNQIQAPYPDAGQYGQLAQQAGMAQQANADRNAMMQQWAAQQRMANQRPGGGMLSSPTVGGGFAGGTGRGMDGPRANYGGNATYGGPGGGYSMVNAPPPSVQQYGMVGAPSLIGAGGMEGTGGYTGYGGFDQTGGGFGGAVSAGGLVGVGGQSVADFAGPIGGASTGGYGFAAGMGGGTGSMDFDEFGYY